MEQKRKRELVRNQRPRKKELEEAVEAHHGDNEDGRAIWETIKKCRDSNTTKQWHC